MRALLFPGQGVQRRGMGKELFEEYGQLTASASDLLGYSIQELCVDDPGRRLRETRYAQPAIFFVNALSADKSLADEPDRYQFMAGHSLGEYNALVAGGYLEILDALSLVDQRARFMSAITGGGMSAVIGPPWQVVVRAIREAGLSEVHVANRNADQQTVIAGDRRQLAEASAVLTGLPAGVGGVATRVVSLNVSGPFHCPLMEPAATALAGVLPDYPLKPGRTAVVSTVTGELFDPDAAVDILSRQVCEPVEWIKAVRTLRALGVTHFDEVNGRTLRSLNEGIR